MAGPSEPNVNAMIHLTQAVESLRETILSQESTGMGGITAAQNATHARNPLAGASIPPNQIGNIGPFEGIGRAKEARPAYKKWQESEQYGPAPISPSEAFFNKPHRNLPPNAINRPSPIPGMTEGERQNILQEGFPIPQFGEWQLDTKLQMARDWSAQMADKNLFGSSKALNQISGAANYGAAHAAQIEVAKRAFKKIDAYGQAASQTGAALGYSPQGGGPFGIGSSAILGFNNPLAPLLSAAGKQGLGQNWDAFKTARFGTGISMAQAREAEGAIASSGFSNQRSGFMGLSTGGDFNNVLNGLFAPLQKEGMSAEAIKPWLETLKDGQVSITELTKSLKGLTGTAKETRQTVDQVSQSVEQYATTAVGAGATPIQGLNAGKSFGNVTGLNPQIASGLLQNPQFQALALTKYGVLPEAIGTLPGPQIAETSLELLKRNLGYYSGVGAVKDPKTGEELVGAGREQLALAAKQSGLTTQQAQLLLEKQHTLPALARAQAAIGEGSNYDQAYQKLTKNDPNKEDVRLKSRLWYESQIAKGFGHGDKVKTYEEEYQKREGKFSESKKKLTKKGEELLDKGGKWGTSNVPGQQQIGKYLQEAGASDDELRELGVAKPEDKKNVAERLLQGLGAPKLSPNSAGASINGVQIGLTPQAQKYFELQGIGEPERSAGAGGTSTTSQALNPLPPSASGLGPGSPVRQGGNAPIEPGYYGG